MHPVGDCVAMFLCALILLSPSVPLPPISETTLMARGSERRLLPVEPSNDLALLRRALQLARASQQAGKTKTPRLRYYEALLHDLTLRSYPSPTVGTMPYAAAEAHRDRLPAARIQTAPENAVLGLSGWESVGPYRVTPPYRRYFGVGETLGRINGIAFSNDGTVAIAIAAQGGAWRSHRIGEFTQWDPLSLDWNALHASCVTIDPTNANRVYVGTGDHHGASGSSFYFGLLRGFGIMRSLDGGATWQNYARTSFGGSPVAEIVVVPESPNIVLAAVGVGASNPNDGIWRSTDFGATWTRVASLNGTGFSALARTARFGNGERYYYAGAAASASTPGGRLLRSGDRGATWQTIWTNAGLATGTGRLALACSPTAPDRVYMLRADNPGSVWRSENSGNNWTRIDNGTFPNGSEVATNYNWSQANYDYALEVGSKVGGGDVVYVGLIDVAMTTDGGANWRSIGGPTWSATNSRTHNDQHCIRVSPADPRVVLVGNDGGVMRPVFNDAHELVDSYNPGTLKITQFYSGAWSPTDPNRALGGTQDNATPAWRGDYRSWTSVGGGDGGGVAISPVDGRVQFASSQGGAVFATRDGWANSTVPTPASYGSDTVPFIVPLATDPSNSQTLYLGTNYVWKLNYTSSPFWNARLGGQVLAGTGGWVNALAVAPSNPNHLFAGTSDGRLWFSGNSGTTWSRIDSGGSGSLPNRAITGIEPHPGSSADVLVTVSGFGAPHLWRGVYSGSGTAFNWTNASGSSTSIPDAPANCVERDPNDPANTWYVGTDIGVLMTTDGGAAWTNATAPLGLPNVRVNALQANRSTGYLNAATFGRGMWRIPIEDHANVVADGSFEFEYAGQVTTFTSGQTIADWTVFGNGATLWGWDKAAAHGGQSLELNGSGAGGVYQDLATVPGKAYRLTFFFTVHPSVFNGRCIVEWNGNEVYNTSRAGARDSWDMDWVRVEATIPGSLTTGETTRLRFRSGTPGAFGPMIDHVVASTEPEGSLVSGRLLFDDMAAQAWPRAVDVGFRLPGDPSSFYEVRIVLGANGEFAAHAPGRGSYDAVIQPPGFLRRTFRVDTASGMDAGNIVSLTVGDLDGSNSVNVADFLLFRAGYGSTPASPNWNAYADLNGDAVVNVLDFIVLRRNLGRNGDG
ncbi:MAG: hypothetical protein KIS66_14240 [Fimbriimonadaceae bacterium]|nr:hypothetical protein [Fimbriimonadaceae bacterium]